jgi:hypothetical protein
MAHGLQIHVRMKTGLKLVWSSSARRGLDYGLADEDPAVAPSLAEARALVDGWVCAGFESGTAAIDDLVKRVAAALARR